MNLFPLRLAKGHVFGMEGYLVTMNFAAEERATEQAGMLQQPTRADKTVSLCAPQLAQIMVAIPVQDGFLTVDDVDRKLM
jgi:hypothetical protein